MGSAAEIVHQPLPSDDPRKRRPDISKAQRILGWTPVVTLEDGLRETVEYFKALSGATARRNREQHPGSDEGHAAERRNRPQHAVPGQRERVEAS